MKKFKSLFGGKSKLKIAAGVTSIVVTVSAAYGFALNPAEIEILVVAILSLTGSVVGVLSNNDKPKE